MSKVIKSFSRVMDIEKNFSYKGMSKVIRTFSRAMEIE